MTLMRDIFLDSKGVLIMLGESHGTVSTSKTIWRNDDRDSHELEKALHSLDELGRVPFALTHKFKPSYVYGAFWFIRLVAKGLHLNDMPFLWSQTYRENTFKALQRIMPSWG